MDPDIPLTSSAFSHLDVAVLIPCLNEERTVTTVIAGFRAALPTAAIYVYDNNSVDRTQDVALAAGAIVRRMPIPGKGNVVRAMLGDIDADIYVLVDGDDTYDAAIAPRIVDMIASDCYDIVQANESGLGLQRLPRRPRLWQPCARPLGPASVQGTCS